MCRQRSLAFVATGLVTRDLDKEFNMGGQGYVQGRLADNKRDRIRVRQIKTCPFSSKSGYGAVAYDYVNTRLSESEVGVEN